MHGRLLTTDRLNKWGIHVNTQCALCKEREETKEHLFVHCTYVRAVWTKVRHWIQLHEPATRDWSE